MSSYALIADLDPGRAARSADFIKSRGLDPVVVRDGMDAIEALKSRGNPAIIVTDLSLPRADGFAVLREAKKLAPQKQPPAVVLSAFRELRLAAETLQSHLGIRAILPHSLSDDMLRAALQQVLTDQPTGEISREEIQEALAEMESARLETVESMGIVNDLPPDEALQDLVRKTAEAFHVPIALVSLILKDRQWFKAHFGLEGEALAARGTPKEWAFCRHVVQGKEPLIVPDAAANPYFASNPMVKAGLVGSYAGAPLVTPGGDVIGTLCIIDSKPLAITASEVEVLALLARRVAGELEIRSKSWKRAAVTLPSEDLTLRIDGNGESAGMTADEVHATLGHVDGAVILVGAGGAILYISPAFDGLLERPLILSERPTRDEFMSRIAPLFVSPAEFLRRVRVDPAGPYSGRDTFKLFRPRHKLVRWSARPVPHAGAFAQLESFTDVTSGG